MSTLHHRKGAPRVHVGFDPLAVFEARCETWLHLYATGEADMLEAVTRLQDAAEKLSEARADIASDYHGLSDSFARLCREADSKQDQPKINERARVFHADIPLVKREGISSERAIQRANERSIGQRGGRYGAAESTVDVVLYALRTHGISAIADNSESLIQLPPDQLEAVIKRLRGLQSKYPAISSELFDLLAELVS